jgi:hypothetical protein
MLGTNNVQSQCVMHPTSRQYFQGCIVFSFVSCATALAIVAAVILLLLVVLAVKAYMAMGTLPRVQSRVTLTRTLRHVHERTKLVNRLGGARTETLLKEVGRG